MGEVEEERNTTSVCFSYGVPTSYDFVSREDRDHFPKPLFLQSGGCKTEDVSL